MIGERDVINAMLFHGGSFAKALGLAWLRADPDNAARLLAAFPELWLEYTELARLRAEMDKASDG